MSKFSAIPAKEVALRLGVNRRTLTRMIYRGDLKPWGKLPGQTGAYIFDAVEVDRLVAEKKVAK